MQNQDYSLFQAEHFRPKPCLLLLSLKIKSIPSLTPRPGVYNLVKIRSVKAEIHNTYRGITIVFRTHLSGRMSYDICHLLMVLYTFLQYLVEIRKLTYVVQLLLGQMLL